MKVRSFVGLSSSSPSPCFRFRTLVSRPISRHTHTHTLPSHSTPSPPPPPLDLSQAALEAEKAAIDRLIDEKETPNEERRKRKAEARNESSVHIKGIEAGTVDRDVLESASFRWRRRALDQAPHTVHPRTAALT